MLRLYDNRERQRRSACGTGGSYGKWHLAKKCGKIGRIDAGQGTCTGCGL